ncbi:MAG: hypothetical protein ABSA91_08505 [Acidimicrobiales bacterium]
MNTAGFFANAKISMFNRAFPSARPGSRVIARNTAVFAVSAIAASLAVGAGATAAAASPVHLMNIDATGLSTNAISISGVTTSPLPTTSEITISLPEGVTTFSAGGGSFYCQPSVTATGEWSLPAPCAGAASGAGTNTLKLTGLPITLDASHLSTGVDPVLYGDLVVSAGSTQTFTLMPQPPVEMVVGSALPSLCSFGLAANGHATRYHCGPSATVSGSTVTFVGFPFSFDARALSTNEYVIDAMSLEPDLTSSATVHNYQLMAANGYTMQIGAAIVASFHWGIGPAGLVTYPVSDSTFLSGQGTTTLVVNGLAARVNATGLGAGTFSLGPDIFGPSFNQAEIQYLHLVPSTYEFASAALASPEYFAWDLQDNGAAGFVAGHPHPCAHVAGPALIVDCSAPTFTEVSGTPNPVDAEGTFLITSQECDRVADVHATGTITFTDLSTGTVLGTSSLVPSSAYANCGEATVVDSEHLLAGTYQVKALYTPSGTLPVPASAPATYHQLVVAT